MRIHPGRTRKLRDSGSLTSGSRSLTTEDIPSTGTQLLELIRILLNSEQELKGSLESRSTTVIAASGTIVTLLIAFITWTSQRNHSPLSGAARFLLAAGIVSLLLAAFAAIMVNAPSRRAKIDPNSLFELMDEPNWSAPGSNVQNAIARRQLIAVIASGYQNRQKAWLLTLSIGAQLLGISLIAFAALEILLSKS
jgi:phosphoglycerol transferase MdoB-like AlkP superfamily enzyme